MTLNERTAEAAAMNDGAVSIHTAARLAAAWCILVVAIGWLGFAALPRMEASFAAQDRAGQEAALGISYRTAGVR